MQTIMWDVSKQSGDGMWQLSKTNIDCGPIIITRTACSFPFYSEAASLEHVNSFLTEYIFSSDSSVSHAIQQKTDSTLKT